MKRIKTIIFLCFAATMAFIAFSGCQRSLVVDFEPLTAPYSDVSLTTETQNSLPLLDRDLPLLTGRTSPSPGTTIPPATGERSDSSTTTEEIILTTKTKPTTTTTTSTTTTTTTTTAKKTTTITTVKKTRTTKKTTTTAKETTTTTETTTNISTTEAPTTSNTTKATEGTNRPDLALEVLRLVNEKRAAAGLNALTMNQSLKSGAELRATEVAIKQSHTRPNGEPYYTAVNPPMWCIELIAWGGYRATPEQVVNGWSNSDRHSKHLTDPYYTEAGVGCYQLNKWPYWCWSMLLR
jgi:uncharacterized protein YkwD